MIFAARTGTRNWTLAVGAAAVSALTAAALGSMPSAAATCVSLFGLGSGGPCTSSMTSLAIAIGENAEAHADGILGAAVTLGNSSSASTVAGALFNLAVTLGNDNEATAGGIASVALVANAIRQTVIAGVDDLTSGSIGNLAVSIGGPEEAGTIANGIANAAINFAGSGSVYARGVGLTTINVVGLRSTLYNAGSFNTIANVIGNNNYISNLDAQGGAANLAFNVIGSDNGIYTSGALAIAGAVGSTGQTVIQNNPGINVSFNRQSAASPASNPRSVSARTRGSR